MSELSEAIDQVRDWIDLDESTLNPERLDAYLRLILAAAEESERLRAALELCEFNAKQSLYISDGGDIARARVSSLETVLRELLPIVESLADASSVRRHERGAINTAKRVLMGAAK